MFLPVYSMIVSTLFWLLLVPFAIAFILGLIISGASSKKTPASTET